MLDLDLYTLAHASLDAGNCVAHVIELGLRPGADMRDLDEAASTLRDCASAALPGDVSQGIDVFTTLTLARLIDIDDRLDHRRSRVDPLLALCEERLARTNALRPLRSRVRRK